MLIIHIICIGIYLTFHQHLDQWHSNHTFQYRIEVILLLQIYYKIPDMKIIKKD
jgi:hypothetical protein